MPRDHARLFCSIWDDEHFVARSDAAQRGYILVMSQKGMNNAGVVPLTKVRWARKSPGGTVAGVDAWLSELDAHRFLVVDEDTQECLVRTIIRNDGVLKQPNVLKNALLQALQTESPRLRLVLAAELRRILAEGLIQVPAHREAELIEETTRAADALDPGGPRDSAPSEQDPPGSLPEPFGRANGSLPEGLNGAATNPVEPQPKGFTEHVGNPSGSLPEGPAYARAHDAGAGAGEVVGVPEEPGNHSARGSSGNVPGARADAPPSKASAGEGPRPPERCSLHTTTADPPPCGHCRAARRAAETWDAAHARDDELARSAEARDRAELRRREIAGCGLCDDDGYLPTGGLCDHDPHRADRAKRGRAAVDAALAAAKTGRPSTEDEP